MQNGDRSDRTAEESIGNIRAATMALRGQALEATKTGNHTVALEFLERAMECAIEIDAGDLLWQIHQAIADTYAALGDYDSAIENLKLAHEILEEINEAETESRVHELQHGYDVEAARREAEIHRLRNVELAEAMAALKSTRNRTIHAERIASLGSLTAGVAHEINNPVNIIKSSVPPLRRDFEELARFILIALEPIPDETPENRRQRIRPLGEEKEIGYVLDEIEQLLEGMESGIARTREIIHGLSLFAPEMQGERRAYPIGMLVDRAIEAVADRFHRSIRLLRERSADREEVVCSAMEIERLLVNIVTNAIQAIGNEGTIMIGSAVAGDMVEIAIADTGCGIEPGVERRIFEPFFTTREVGAGVGLGLSIAYAIAARHDGGITVSSTPGKGSTFVVALPRVI